MIFLMWYGWTYQLPPQYLFSPALDAICTLCSLAFACPTCRYDWNSGSYFEILKCLQESKIPGDIKEPRLLRLGLLTSRLHILWGKNKALISSGHSGQTLDTISKWNIQLLENLQVRIKKMFLCQGFNDYLTRIY